MAENIAQITNFSHIFKGISLIILSLFSIGFAYYMNKKWKEPKSFWFAFYMGLSIFILLFGLYVLLFNPSWWALPY